LIATGSLRATVKMAEETRNKEAFDLSGPFGPFSVTLK
jgi:hypothetical protein